MTPPTIISVDEALEAVLSHTSRLSSERLALPDALNRVLAEDIASRREHPPWNNSAMDGYAVRWEDIQDAGPESPAILDIVGEVQAGGMPSRAVAGGEAIQIMTGAPLPAGADSVVRVEDTERSGDRVKIHKPCKKGGNVRLKGEDVRQGVQVVAAGTLCRPAELGMLATAACMWVDVYQRPKVSVLATGNELAEPGDALGPEKIINSNAFSIAALAKESGALAVTLKTATDTKDDLEAKIRQALNADVGIVIGGVSVGKYDYVKDVLNEIGCTMKFWRVKMRPGHPVAFGVMPSHYGPAKLLFGLPGNPVSCMVAFYQFVRPALRRMMGLSELFLPEVEAVLEEAVRSRPGRRHFARAVTTYREGSYFTRLTGAQGSGILTSMVQANSLMILPEDGAEFSAGQRLRVQLLPGARPGEPPQGHGN